MNHSIDSSPLADSKTIHWPRFARMAFRFVYAYIALYAVYGFSVCYSSLIWELHPTNSFNPMDAAFSRFVPWFGLHILRIHEAIAYSLESDTPYDWVENVILILIAILVAILWSTFDRKRPHYRAWDQWLRLLVRLSVASLMFLYGFDKVFPNQFHMSIPNLTHYIQPFGDLDHFTLLWQFMGASTGYTVFSGLLEVTAGALLLVPPLTNLGALLTATVMANVVALNLAYNVPVKLFSFNIFLMAVFLLAPQLPRLANVLVLNHDVPPMVPARLSSHRKVDLSARILQGVLGAAICVLLFFANRSRYEALLKADAVAVPMHGIWVLDQFNAPTDTAHPLFTPKLAKELSLLPGEDRWLRLIFQSPQALVIQTVDGQLDYVSLALDKSGTTADITDPDDASWKVHLALDRSQKDRLHLVGTINGVPVDAMARRIDDLKFRIRDEGLHLVNR